MSLHPVFWMNKNAPRAFVQNRGLMTTLALVLAFPLLTAAALPPRLIVELHDNAADLVRSNGDLPVFARQFDPLAIALEPVFYEPQDPQRQVIWRELGMHRHFRMTVKGRPATDVAARLVKSSELAGWSLSYAREIEITPNDHSIYTMYGLDRMQLPQAWDIYHDNSPVVISTLDTGCPLDHPDLAANIHVNPGEDLNANGVWDASDNNGIDDDNNGFVDDLTGWDFVSYVYDPDDFGPNQGLEPSEDYGPRDNFIFPDINGHGTHVSGTSAAVTNNGIGVAAASWNVRNMPCRIGFAWLDGSTLQGAGFDEDMAAAIQYATDNGSRVISLSFGGGDADIIMPPAIQYARLNNVIFFASAGNGNNNLPHYPSDYPGAISVAATDEDDVRAWFSNYGANVDLAAPGVRIWSTMSNNPYHPWDYARYNGTSMATPNAAAVAALIISYRPCLTDDEVETLLLNSCDNIDAANPGFAGQLGAGRVNAFNALNSLGISPIVQNLAATDDACDSVIVTWTNTGGGNGIRVLRDGVPVATLPANATRYADAPPGGTYHYAVYAFSGCGATPASADIGSRILPQMPANLNASLDGCDSIIVTWTESGPVDSVRILRNGIPVATLPAGVERFADAPRPAGDHLYSVMLLNACGAGPAASDLGRRWSIPGMVSVTASQGLCNSIRVDWSIPGMAQSFRVVRNGQTIGFVNAPDNWYVDSPVAGPHTYSVVARNYCGEGPAGSGTGFSYGPLGPVPNVVAGDDRCDSVIVTWGNLTGESQFHVYRNGDRIASLPNNTLRYADAPPPGDYLYTVRGENWCGLSPPASDSSHCPLSSPDAQTPPPEDFLLEQNFPNPFNPTTTIRIALPYAADVTLTVFDVLGRRTTTLAQGLLPAGRHAVTWDCPDCPAGMYLVRMEAAGIVQMRKMLLMK